MIIRASLYLLKSQISDCKKGHPHLRYFIYHKFQNIVYGEYVLDIVGPALVEEYSLNPGTSSVYQPDRNPAITNAFATAAFRFGHSQERI